ncbi:NTP pyrophosphohydrolase [Corynebacterium atypicum]|uniref:NTP pyrophosphohydrolase n=1 Tax=Corynebacterium atypicum TaxID=191610 RepID=A0ABN4DD68_9CORY|nr:bifunctional NUDIX hydrolase/histidine phosphatase family protein [Corynebacterium atypicum]AIG64235.1 NTP pyrophosphohydrolase [Corynebacterium atypicum]
MPHHEIDKDDAAQLLVTGRFQRIPRDPASQFPRATLAAGAVIYRRAGDATYPPKHAGTHPADEGGEQGPTRGGNSRSIEVALVHRPRYNDWSLPKGKVDPGENVPQTAHREILEETGIDARLEKLVGTVTYPVKDRTKVVFYWTASVADGEFSPRDDEVDELRWVPADQVGELLSYQVDAEVVAKAAKRIALEVDTRVLLVRHARAHQRHNWAGDDYLRPLDKKGRRQAHGLVPLLAAFHPTAVYAAEPDRCQQTAAPIAQALGLKIEVDRAFGDDGWLENMTQAQDRFLQIATSGGVPVVVGQGLIIPDLIAWLSARGSLPLGDEVMAKKASTWVLSFSKGRLVGADYLASPLPAK